MHTLLFALATLVLVSPALAAEGRIEISPHDLSPANPTYVIDKPGSYVLTGTLIQHDPAQPVIEILSKRVTLDLNGFGIEGTWSGTGTGAWGIKADSARIRNGYVHGTFGGGIVNGLGVVEDVTVTTVGGPGISGPRWVRRCEVTQAKQVGILAQNIEQVYVEFVTGSYVSYGAVAVAVGQTIRDSTVSTNNGHAILATGSRLIATRVRASTTAQTMAALPIYATDLGCKAVLSSLLLSVSGSQAPSALPPEKYWNLFDPLYELIQ